jgi:hypothetical protein
MTSNVRSSFFHLNHNPGAFLFRQMIFNMPSFLNDLFVLKQPNCFGTKQLSTPLSIFVCRFGGPSHVVTIDPRASTTELVMPMTFYVSPLVFFAPPRLRGRIYASHSTRSIHAQIYHKSRLNVCLMLYHMTLVYIHAFPNDGGAGSMPVWTWHAIVIINIYHH